MAKTYINTVKYLIKGKIKIDGIVEKPDVVGAIFGQTEGLLGEDMDLRDLQKSGRIGRIEVDMKTKSGKTHGTLVLASSMDKFQTATLGAALETVDRVGPCEADVTITKIEDTRAKKRGFVVNRAKQLLKNLVEDEMPESKEISSKIKSEVKKAKVTSYGKEKVPAGPDIPKSSEIVVVEGRADVLNLLRYGINNVISLKGSKVPKSVANLSKKKKTTLFVDGDRGGDLVVKQFDNAGKIDYVAKAPDGKEVEELTQKEILKQLKNKTSFKDFKSKGKRKKKTGKKTRKSRKKTRKKKKKKGPDLYKIYDGLKGSMKAALVKGNKVEKIGVAEMIEKIKKKKKLDAIVFDGIITQRLVDLANSKGINTLVGLKKAKLKKTGKVKVKTMD